MPFQSLIPNQTSGLVPGKHRGVCIGLPSRPSPGLEDPDYPEGRLP
jgi:hypothetical protein